MNFTQPEFYYMMARYGVENISTTDPYCQELYTAMVRNYPCMKEGICYPHSDLTIVIVFILFFMLVFYGGYKYREWKK